MSDSDAALQRPTSQWAMFVAFTQLALQGFGGVIAVAQRELCDRRRWLDNTEFVELLATAQVLPGPNVCNLALIVGDRFFGWRGALVALSGMLSIPLVILLSVAWLLGSIDPAGQAHEVIEGALRGIAAVAAGQLIGMVLRLVSTLKNHALGPRLALVVAALTFVMMAWLRWPLVWVLLGLGGLSCVITYQRLRAPPTASNKEGSPE